MSCVAFGNAKQKKNNLNCLSLDMAAQRDQQPETSECHLTLSLFTFLTSSSLACLSPLQLTFHTFIIINFSSCFSLIDHCRSLSLSLSHVLSLFLFCLDCLGILFHHHLIRAGVVAIPFDFLRLSLVSRLFTEFFDHLHTRYVYYTANFRSWSLIGAPIGGGTLFIVALGPFFGLSLHRPSHLSPASIQTFNLNIN